MSPEVQRDIDRIVAIWQSCHERYAGQGGMLFGRFSVADAYYAPVVMRFMTHAVALPPQAQAYADAVRALPSVREWMAAARQETEFVAADEPYAQERREERGVRRNTVSLASAGGGGRLGSPITGHWSPVTLS